MAYFRYIFKYILQYEIILPTKIWPINERKNKKGIT